MIAVRVNGELRDLDTPAADGDTVEPVEITSPDGLDILRHSTAHVMAQAVQNLFPEAKLGIGPPVKNGFYYDFDVERPFTPEDLKAVEKKMQEIVKRGQRFSRRVVTDEAAREELANEPYKLELIGLKGSPSHDDGTDVEVGAGELTVYDNLDAETGEPCWKDLCRGPHLPSTRHIPAFKLMRNAAAYWRGSEKNPMLQRIYGTAWPSRDALKAHLDLLAEAEKRDHRRLGAELDLFSFPDEIGSGLPVFHPKGTALRQALEDYSRKRHRQAGYQFVTTPHITKENLFRTSGHLQWYADGMYPPMELDEGATYYLKPMNCPMHNLIYRSRGRSYRELPLRLFEFGTVYRYEKSGVVHGLTRVRGLTMDDAHIYCTPGQLGDELRSVLRFVLDLLADYGLTDFHLELSTRDPASPKYVGSDEDWAQATAALREAAGRENLELVLDEGGAAFYGPKISVQARDAIGRSWQMSTIQVDFQLPQRFELEYQSAEGTRERPIMIHRALFGSIERFLGVLTEHYAGAFPAWLAPVQVVAIPITGDQVPYLQQIAERLRGHDIRVEVDAGSDRMQKKIRTAQQQKVPYMLLAGQEDVAQGAVSFRYRNGEQKNFVPVDEAVEEILRAVQDRTLD
ncbi:threonine--tRNA ligase [Kitasatospora sp. MBT63]|uniref:threonine--tRNA ligase n=1 Tax=Kitasatospora sp. MBT63 TaxID=1444768 RepID=UPI001E48672D|nr:threonine--tRNA ligase [Kitasatospora sp. MBT63]